MNIIEYSHNFAETTLDQGIANSMREVLRKTPFNFEERDAKHYRNLLKDKLSLDGWSNNITIEKTSNISITSYNNKHGLCLQTGNMGRFYADLLKLEYTFKNGKIIGGFYVIPTKSVAKQIGDNIANFERLTNELQIFSNIITVPLLVFGLKK